MSGPIVRSGPSKKFQDNFVQAFGNSSPASATAETAAPAAEAAKTAKPAKAAKKAKVAKKTAAKSKKK